MDAQTVAAWESQLSSQQQARLNELRARKCRVEAVLVPGDEAGGSPTYVRVSVTVDHLLLASARTADDIPAAFDEVAREANQKLRLGT